ncbi:hypothetical protein SAMN04489844_3623 [Nocardioides exalbidus]|uniref:Htaa protein n=1 Tax=Nocardioides exalbidus TaxID=402596 RepID=A0A1H4XS83_9ACTN|nr:hypothetical protein [Nocardioides exalbidus]SED07731.1 hypothetical protein SAMN04489844_3623 [Nocardioides exalbidus]
MQLRNILGIVATGAALGAMSVAPAHADTRTLAGPTTGDSDTFLTYVGCDGVFTAGAAPQSRINLGPYSAPLGRRSLGIVPTGGGSASGPYSSFTSLAGVDASLSVAATAGSQGVSYVVAITSDSPAGTAWAGRAPVTAPAGGWTQVSSASLTYDWSLVDLGSRRQVSAAGSATPADFAAEHGDGAGFVVTGFGCDARPFNLDAVRAGGSTFDFEGLSLTTAISTPAKQVAAGDDVTLTGRVADGSGRVTGDPLVLESRTGNGAWTPVGGPQLAGADGLARVVVPVSETTEFRWHRPQSQYADEGWSDTVTVTVAEPVPSEAPDKK